MIMAEYVGILNLTNAEFSFPLPIIGKTSASEI
jgi:hypothetical protein